MKESRNLEYKESVTNTFLKTVSAYANYGTGKIIFGIRDDGTIKGIENIEQTCLDIENRINDNIDPVPEFSLSVDRKKALITLVVSEGLYKPYLYKAKAYRRSDSASIPIGRLELTRLILEGQNMSFEELSAGDQNLTFSVLEEKLIGELHLQNVTNDTLKTLELYRDDTGYNKAAELLSDKNAFTGIDMVRFGESFSIILDRETYDRRSVLEQYDRAVYLYKKYYQYEKINGIVRETVYQIPEDAFREAIANALVHRTWDVNTNINVAMFPDRIEITSPGGLPDGMSEDDFHKGGISILRNRIIGNIFFRLRLIERFGIGIRRINESYKTSAVKPVFELSENSIRIILPVTRDITSLSSEEEMVYRLLIERLAPISELIEKTGFGKTKLHSILKKLESKGYIRKTGTGRGLKYTSA